VALKRDEKSFVTFTCDGGRSRSACTQTFTIGERNVAKTRLAARAAGWAAGNPQLAEKGAPTNCPAHKMQNGRLTRAGRP